MSTPSLPDDTAVRPTHARRRVFGEVAAWVVSAAAGVLGFTLVYANTVVAQVDDAFSGRDVSNLISEPPTATDTAPTANAASGANPNDENAGQPINILLMGSDSRAGANGDIGGRVAEGMRNDTTIIMHISADRSRIQMVSIPRDAQVTIPTCKFSDGSTIKGWTGDFNIAFSNGGRHGDPAEAAACVINTVQKMTGLHIDHWAVVDFVGFEKMINALGGVPMCIPEHIVSKKARLDLKAGPQVLDGREALAFARLRTAEVGHVSGSDLQRINRQHELLHQVAATVLSKNLLTDAGDLTKFLRAAAESLTMDTQLADTKYLLGLAFSLRNIRTSDIQMTTVPWKYTADYLNVTILPSADQMWKDMRNDAPLSVVGTDTASSVWDSGRSTDTPSPQPTTSGADSESVTQQLLQQCR